MSAASGDPSWNYKLNETLPLSMYRYSGSLAATAVAGFPLDGAE
jgi:hypothetical protein